ncbi:MAG: helicase-related protein, partial [Thiobacillus sp.]|nr:helicase-related protein [Thiobacillus sp.]
DTILNQPTFIEVARNATAVTVTQVVHPVHHERKRQLLTHLIKTRDLKQVLVFTGTKLGCNRLANELNKLGLHADAIHGDKTQQERIKALDAFKAGTLRVLVATDVAARGIDIEALPFVVNYDLPHNAEDYVHRIGRTGRAGIKGEAISLVSESETRYLKDIEKLIGTALEPTIVPGFEPGAADVPAYESRPPRMERPAERSAERPVERVVTPAIERSAPRGQRPASRDALFDSPYVPSAAPAAAPAASRQPSRKPVAALFRSPVKPESTEQ